MPYANSPTSDHWGSATEQPRLERPGVQLGRQRPAQPLLRDPLRIRRDRTHAGRAGLDYRAVGQPGLMLESERGRAAASRLGHTLTRWKRRAYAPSTAATAFCKQCRATALVNLEHASDAYGFALTKPCSAPKTDPPA